ncbi:ATPase, T2SS/T4P/T4SS family [Leifsonia sp. Leaf264]|uniref:ATPase, T2SS/T4P/T4SS family n=1 Tax=Leifsonia sp. Leaf264 TaxID=1736314 RepID=UPI0006FEB6F2|nr:ATPase, T2SS/T4P/T4SS family [Leifsonia sp. Leaf264]KQO98905.1 hypothetical protein ASF30_12650 [Leifsonia sp. Leaf264]
MKRDDKKKRTNPVPPRHRVEPSRNDLPAGSVLKRGESVVLDVRADAHLTHLIEKIGVSVKTAAEPPATVVVPADSEWLEATFWPLDELVTVADDIAVAEDEIADEGTDHDLVELWDDPAFEVDPAEVPADQAEEIVVAEVSVEAETETEIETETEQIPVVDETEPAPEAESAVELADDSTPDVIEFDQLTADATATAAEGPSDEDVIDDAPVESVEPAADDVQEPASEDKVPEESAAAPAWATPDWAAPAWTPPTWGAATTDPELNAPEVEEPTNTEITPEPEVEDAPAAAAEPEVAPATEPEAQPEPAADVESLTDDEPEIEPVAETELDVATEPEAAEEVAQPVPVFPSFEDLVTTVPTPDAEPVIDEATEPRARRGWLKRKKSKTPAVDAKATPEAVVDDVPEVVEPAADDTASPFGWADLNAEDLPAPVEVPEFQTFAPEEAPVVAEPVVEEPAAAVVDAPAVFETPAAAPIAEPVEVSADPVTEAEGVAVTEPAAPAADSPFSPFGGLGPTNVVFGEKKVVKKEEAPAPQVIVVQAPAPAYPQFQQPAPAAPAQQFQPAPAYQAPVQPQAPRPVAELPYDSTPYQPAPEQRTQRVDPGAAFEPIVNERDPFFSFGSSRPSTPARINRSREVAIETGVNAQTWLGEKVNEALLMDASDIHATVNGARDHLLLRARIDGTMREFAQLEGADAQKVMGIFKAGAQFASDGSFVPQEAIYGVPVDGEVRKARAVLFRSEDGGDALVMRLPSRGAVKPLEELEFSEKNLNLFYDMLAASNRMVMIAGPMGSGKTTTAHGSLMHVATGDRTVWTLEDPVERRLPGLTQLEVDEKNGAGFKDLLPFLVRSDYDTLFLGEIRDNETAAAAVRQSKAGRQVISTIHANDNVTAALRLIELAQDSPLAVMDAVKGIVSQRLVRRLNPEWDGVDPLDKYRGRVPIHEVLTMNDQLIEAVMENRPLGEIREVADAASASTFEEDSARLVEAGITDEAEIRKVLGQTTDQGK